MEGILQEMPSVRAMLAVAALLSAALVRAETCHDPIIEILVSPLVNKYALRIMDLSWDVGSVWKPGDWVGLYNVPPTSQIQPLFRAQARNAMGSVRTGLQEGRLLLEPNFYRICLGWWAAYWHSTHPTPVAVSCLGTNPRWMEELKPLISSLRLNEAFIPGTHDSGAFHMAYSSFSDNRVTRYIYNQDENIMEQLIHGARYLDLRVTLHKGEFWVNHGIAKVHPLEYILRDVKTFIDNTRELVILDFHEFQNGEGFKSRETHHRLIELLHEVLGEHLAPPHLGWSVTLGQLWRIDKRIIVAYNDKNVVREKAREIWWPVVQVWANKRKIQDLYSYFKNIYSRGMSTHGIFWCAMAELTPSTWDVILDKPKGLRKLADDINKNVTTWFREDWGVKTNGVAVDFIRSTGIVETAIRWNKRKGRNSFCD